MNQKITGLAALTSLFPAALLLAIPLLLMADEKKEEKEPENKPKSMVSKIPVPTALPSKPIIHTTLRRGDCFLCPDTGIMLQVRAKGRRRKSKVPPLSSIRNVLSSV